MTSEWEAEIQGRNAIDNKEKTSQKKAAAVECKAK